MIQQSASAARQRGARCNNPTASAFTPFFKSLLVKDLNSSHSMGANCEEEESEVFLTLKNFLLQGISEESDELESIDLTCLSGPSNKLNMLEQQALKYVGGYLIKMSKKKIKNCSCVEKYLEKKDADDFTDDFTKLKEFKNCHLKYISDYFFFEMCKALNTIKCILNTSIHKKHIFRKIFHILMSGINLTDCIHNEILKKNIIDKFLKTVGHNFITQMNRFLDGKDQRRLPKNAPIVFKKCRLKYIKCMKKSRKV